ncbi:TPA: hypothetical protein N0F65_010606 [Lagenidium giganteum]|uniref:ZSWIM1/3 RNaseH-like domain-containing protein n=1 Tax=Lagenidium giganteum TaxID=4803 RepID=A0AAV2ZAH1_9STRA|nr:TPA: hypothetical protein N0F65_010606 [Lagenidium giganteum]
MRQLFGMFPEVIMVDTTYKTNSMRYKLFSIMVEDAFGLASLFSMPMLTRRLARTWHFA